DLLSTLQRPVTRLIDCEGKTVVPGFEDAHCHVLAFARRLLSLDCSPPSVGSIEDIKARLREQAALTPRGSWIICSGYNEFHLAEKRHPTRRDLDEAAPDHPVKLGHFSGHMCVLNNAGLQAIGITNDTAGPPGAVIDRELETGQPNGLLHEMNYVVDRAMPAFAPEVLDQAVAEASRRYLSLGITSLQDATADNDLARYCKFIQFKANGTLKPRLTMMAGVDHADEFAGAGLHPNSGGPGLRLGAVKLMLTESTGSLFPPQDELNRLVSRIHLSGGQVAMHAIEERTIEAAVAALAYCTGGGPRRDHRHRIEHCSECTTPLLERIKAVGAVIVTQPPFLYYSGDRYLVQVPASQQAFLYRVGSFWRTGVTTAASSDSPVVQCNPLIGIYAAVTRKSMHDRAVLAEEAISPMQALAMYTVNAAYSSFQENVRGSITPGKLADLALLSADPTSVPPGQIKDIVVEKTVLGGEVVWER
ncbi:MAG TPA: amidohydrolase, partial [Dehalococcoidia bacterium]|nr:amidohydrolase [Dehalococcoidia bacterium]